MTESVTNENMAPVMESEDTRTEFKKWVADHHENRLTDLDASAADYVYTMMQGAILCAIELFQRPSESTIVEIFKSMMRRADMPDEMPIRGFTH